MSMQDTASPGVALWRLVADGIERGIADGRFAAGEKLPGEMEIAETYRVNRHTVRRALATLAERGLVRAERGSGTYVEAQRLAYPLRSRTRFSEIVGAGGREPRGQLIDASGRRRDARTGARTGIEDRRAAGADRGDPARRPHADLRLHHLAVRGTVSGRGAGIRRDALDDQTARALRRPRLRRGSTRITAAIVDATDAARLDLALGRPVLVVDSTDVDLDGKPLRDQALALCRRAGRVSGGERLN